VYIKSIENKDSRIETELIEEDGEGESILFEIILETKSIPDTFYVIDDYSDEQIELQSRNYLSCRFVVWFEDRMEIGSDGLTTRELRRGLYGLDDKELKLAREKAIEKLGESIEGYIDHDDLYLSDEMAGTILNKGMDCFWETIDDNYWNDSGDEYYEDHVLFMYKSLELTDEEIETYKDEILECVREWAYVSYDYSKAVDYTEVKLNLAITFETDYIYGWQSIDYSDECTKIEDMPEEYGDVLAIFGYELADYIGWYNSGKDPEHAFFKSFEAEIDNSGQGFTEIVFLLKCSLAEALEIKESKKIKIGTSVMCGMFDFWNGGGSILELDYQEDIEITMTDKISVRVDGQSGQWDVDSVYGLCGDAWVNECEVLIKGGEND